MLRKYGDNCKRLSSFFMTNIIKGKKDQIKRDQELVKKIKPKLKKFVIDQQVQNAAKVAEEKKEEEKLLLQSNEVINRAGKLACIAMLDKKLWQQMPSYFEMKWTKLGPTSEELIREMQGDIGGFATFLVREYNTYLKYHAVGRGYPNPMQDEHLVWFWAKFNADLRLLVEADKRRIADGNNGAIVETKTENGIIIPKK